jgi:amino acid adenylation domain-containing protein
MTDLALSAGTETWPLGPEQRVAAEHPEAASVLIVGIVGDLDEARLRAALLRVASRHEILRTAFVAVPGFRGLRARPLDAPVEPAWSVLDLRGRADAADAMTQDLAAQTGFDLGSGRTLRAALYCLGDAEWRLAVLASPLVADRGALDLIHRALRDEYAGAAVPANEDGVAYAQYVEWRAEMAAAEDAAEGRRYWQDHLGPSAPPVLHLPYRRHEASPGARASREAVIDTVVAQRLADLAAAHGIGFDAVLQAAWWALLARIAGRAELVTGWQHDCRRDYDAFAETVGPFDKVLPLRLAADPAESFSSFLNRLASLLDSHRGWQEHWPVEAPGRSDHLIAGFRVEGPAANGVWRLVSADAWQPFELALQAGLAEDGSLRAVALHWDGSRYDDAAMATLLEQVVTLLSELPDRLDMPLGALSPVGEAERARLSAFDATAQAPAPGPSLPALIARWGCETPTAPALAGGGVTLDYAGLNARVDGLAAWLVAHGVGRESVVALDMARSADMVVALLAVWRAGGAYLPLDPQWPQARRQLLLEQARPVLVLTDAAEPVVSDTVPVHPLAAALAEPASAALPDLDHNDPARAAYVLFTSGSTGTPKGVVIEHGQLRTYVEAVSAALGLAGCRRFALTSTVAADLGNTVLFGALRHGACLAVADEAEMADGVPFAGFLRRHGIDCAKLVPSHLAALLDAPEPVLPATLILGGEATPRTLVERILAIAPKCRVFNHYGPTETTVGVLVHAHDTSAWAGDALPLSRPLAGSEVLVLDAAGRLAPTGAVGELHIGGAQLCRGYLHGDPAEAFVDHPFREGRRLYRSGDLARHLPDGSLQVVGRADHQVKIRGFRVEPGEVEAALQALDGVQQAAVVVHRPEGAEARLVGFVTLASGDAAALRPILAARLPGPMVPAQIVALDRMPRLANGKIDRRGLPDPATLAETSAKVAPRDAVETLLRQVAAELLERPAEAIGVTDDFFDIGGNSLQVIKLVARIRKLFQLAVPPGIVFDHPSIAALAQALRGHAAPGRIDQIATLRLSLDGMSEAERAALLEKARQAKAL